MGPVTKAMAECIDNELSLDVGNSATNQFRACRARISSCVRECSRRQRLLGPLPARQKKPVGRYRALTA